ncbi:hypothetical protein B0H19DRAFT_1138343 [Mycena capillaripes]|nr:hypothetical protein B0H19DRAFT_1138343 [Mycena capillaripes]
MACPSSGTTWSGYGPRGCAWLGGATQSSSETLYGAPKGPDALNTLAEKEKKTICEVLLPEAPSREKTNTMLSNADSLNPSEVDVLAFALGAPARRVLDRADKIGPLTGWRDGFLSTNAGFCPPDPNAAPAALGRTPGRVWSDLCSRLPGLIARGRVREAILQLPQIDGSPETIPDAALWAAVVCLGILASIWRYEGANDGHEGIVKGASKEHFYNIAGEPDEEPETKGIPRNIVIPFRLVCTRLGRPLPYLSQSDVGLHNYKIRDPTSSYPYVARIENMDLRWPIFNDRGEAMFLLCMAETHGLFTPGPDLMARCQEHVMAKDNDGLLVELIKLKEVIDQLGYVFHKISVNPRSGENFANPTFWGQGYAKFSAPLSKRLPALSGLFLPVFQCIDAFLLRTNFDSFLGIESIHLRAWMPLNIRAFLAAIENHYPVPTYVKQSGDPRLIGVLDAIVESYLGERGFMGTHRYKVYGFLEVVAKTGRVETNGGAGATDDSGRPWREVHKTLAHSMKERLEPYRSKALLEREPHEMRGSYDECRFWVKITSRTTIDDDPMRNTGKITLDTKHSGLTFIPGDRLAVMLNNSWSDVEAIVDTLGLIDFLDVNVPLSTAWKRYARHEIDCSHGDSEAEPCMTVRDILKKGRIAPLTKEMVLSVYRRVKASPFIQRVLEAEAWPVNGSLGDLLIGATGDFTENIWNTAFSLDDLSWLSEVVVPEVPRTYSVSSFPFELMPETIDLTVTRAQHEIFPLLRRPDGPTIRGGVCSSFLNPFPNEDGQEEQEVLVGISRPLNFQLPLSPAAHAVMFAGGSGIAPFRSFWQARLGSPGVIGRNVLFLGVQSRDKFLYKHELRKHVLGGKLELHVAFSRDKNGLVYDPVRRDLVDKKMDERYIDAAIVDEGATVADMIISTKLGGLGGYMFVCGSLSLYETVIVGIRKALYKYRAVTKTGADELLAQAFAERRFMLDVFMTPRVMKVNEPMIPLSELSLHTGHREGSRMWLGVHGCVYDVTDFLPIHPGGTLIVAASAGLDCSVTFDEVGHTSNPEVMSLLGKYFIGYLCPTPTFHSAELADLYNGWTEYLRIAVEALTTMSFEVDTLIKDSQLWFSGGILSTHAIRKFYQLQSRLLTKTGFPVLFGTKLQEIFLKLSFAIANNDDTSPLPDIMGIVNHATSSPSAIKAKREIAELGEFVTNQATQAPAFEGSIIKFTRAILDLDVAFLEKVRDEICAGHDAFHRVADVIKEYPKKESQAVHKISTVLMSYLQRIAERVDSFYVDLAAQSLYNPSIEANPAKARWVNICRRVKDRSFFVLTKDKASLNLDQDFRAASTFETKRSKRQSVSFDQILSSAVSSVNRYQPPNKSRSVGRSPSARAIGHIPENGIPPVPPLQPQHRARRLADAHIDRARGGDDNNTSFDDRMIAKSANRMSQFMQSRMKDIRRLSKAPELSLDHAMAMYGNGPGRGRQVIDEGEHSPYNSAGSSDESSPPPPASRTHSRQTSFDRLNGSHVTTSSHSRTGSNPRPAMSPSRAPSVASTSTVRTVGGIRKPASRSELHNATFSRKLSMYSTSGSVAGGDGSLIQAVPPVPPKSHW